jgi:Bacterial Ig domain
MWFTELEGHAIARVSVTGATSGEVTEFSKGFAGFGTDGITAGPDGNVWFAETYGNRIVRFDLASGEFTAFSEGLTREPMEANVSGLAAGADGNLWFTEPANDRVGRITPTGKITEYSKGITTGGTPVRIALGPDGNMWFTEVNASKIGRITPAGEVTEFSSGISPNAGIGGIAAGPDGNVWFTESGTNRIGRIIARAVGVPECESERTSTPAGGGSVTVALSCSGAPGSYAIVGPPTHGALSAVSNGHVTYTSFSGYSGQDTFTYEGSNGNGPSGLATVTIDVPPAPTPTAPLVASVGSGGVLGTQSGVQPPRVEAKITWEFGWTRRYTIVTALVLRKVPSGAIVEMVCRGGGCPVGRQVASVASKRRCSGKRCRKKHRKLAPGEVSLSQTFKGRRLGVGSRIEISVSKPGWIGKAFTVSTRAGAPPTVTIACLAPGGHQPGVGCE